MERLFVGLVAAVALGTPAAAVAATTYPGSSPGLMPTAKEVGFIRQMAFQPTKKPIATLAQGYKNGVSAMFQKGTTRARVDAVATVYVYSSRADAKLAWQHACNGCTPGSAPKGIRLKTEAGTISGARILHHVTVCANVYLEVTEQAHESVSKLDTDVAKITNAVYARAFARGLSSCAAK